MNKLLFVTAIVIGFSSTAMACQQPVQEQPQQMRRSYNQGVRTVPVQPMVPAPMSGEMNMGGQAPMPVPPNPIQVGTPPNYHPWNAPTYTPQHGPFVNPYLFVPY